MTKVLTDTNISKLLDIAAGNFEEVVSLTEEFRKLVEATPASHNDQETETEKSVPVGLGKPVGV